MKTSEQLDMAITAHAKWKGRLRDAIETGRSDWSLQRLRSDTLCDFGKWLQTLPLSERLAERFQRIRDLHRDFHAEAAKILSMALSGQRAEAEAALALGSAFGGISCRLVLELEAWRQSAAAV